MDNKLYRFICFIFCLVTLIGCDENLSISSQSLSETNTSSYKNYDELDSEIVNYYLEVLPYSSRIFCWQNNNEVWRCATIRHIGESMNFMLDYFVDIITNFSCSLHQMKLLIDDVELPSPETYFVFEIPNYVNDDEMEKWYLFGDHELISTNKYLYEQLGLLEQYNRIISSSK